MSRGLGGIELLGDALPPWAIELLGELTVLGDTVTIAFAFLLVYWLHERAAGASLFVIFVGGVVLLVAFKAGFALPRPPADLRAVAVDGYGFPSGHAFNATVGFGLLARLRPAVRPRLRYGIATAGVLLVAISRVAIGAHYTIDVLAGVALGLIYLVVAWRAVWPQREALLARIDRLRPKES